MSAVRVPKPLVLMLLFMLLAACAGTPPREAAVIRGEQDNREYRYLELPNRMRVLLVSDPQTDKAAASLHVRAGSGNDPRARQGLAHFLEHMLFLGTAGYPDPGEYQAFISAHGGSHNAYTSVDHTNYFFDIEPGSLTPALDRFAQFFVAPLFNREYVEREMNAVDSEYKLGLKDDARREYDVLRELVRPEHPLGALAVGNLSTLGEGASDIREDLLAFYAQHYSANVMTLVVLGRESLDELQAMVSDRFGAVADRSATELTHVPSMFAPGTLPLEVRIRPEQELRELTLLFPLPSARAHYAAKPLEYIGGLLGDEGPGSPLSVLKARGWAESLSAGAGLDLYGEDAFQLSLQLTEEGVAHYRDIVALLFRAIARLEEDGVEEWRFSEQTKLGDLAFRFREKGSPTGAVIALSNALQDYPVSEALRGPYLFRDYEPALIHEYLGYLRPDNVLLTLSHRDVQTDRESRWFSTPYAVQKLDAGDLARQAAAADGALTLPAPNEFIPERVALKPLQGKADRPALLADEPALSPVALAGQRLPGAQGLDIPGAVIAGRERQCPRCGARGAAGAAGERRAQRVRLSGEPRGAAVQRRVRRARAHREGCRLRRQAARAARQGAADPAAGPVRGRSIRWHQDRDAARLGQQRQAAPLPATGRRDAREPGGPQLPRRGAARRAADRGPR